MNKAIIERIDQLIRMKATGTPKELALKLEISERSVYNYINEMKREFLAPIEYSDQFNSYVYKKTGRLRLQFIENNTGK